MRLLVLLLLSTIVTVNANCRYTATDGSIYDLSKLTKFSGKPYSYVDAKGDEWLFNICGQLGSLEAPKCPKDASICLVSNGVGVDAGRRSSWNDFVPPNHGVEIIYAGESCDSTRLRKTTFEFVCKEDLSSGIPLVVENVHREDECYSVIKISSPFACPIHRQVEVTHVTMIPPFLFMAFLLSVFVIFCLCLCACCARRRRRNCQRNQELQMIQFSNEAFHQSNHGVSPSAPPRYSPSAPMQYLQAPPYFLYPSVQNPIQQESEGLLSADEALARSLQAQFDSEANV